MHTRLTLKSGQKGTKRLVARYGDRLVCVRYRYDEKKKKRYKTIELVIEETDWAPKVDPLKGATLVRIRVEWEETALRQRVKDAGGRWNPDEKVWELRYDKSVALGLKKRILGAVTL